MNGADDVLRKYWRAIAVFVGLVLVFGIFYALRMVLLPFMIALVLAYITLPLVSWIENRLPRSKRHPNGKRISAIAIVYLLIVLILGVFFFFTVSALIDAIRSLSSRSVEYFSSASSTLKQWTDSLRQMVPPEIRDQLDSYIQEAGVNLLSTIRDNVMNGIAGLSSAIGLILGLAAVPFFLFYVLKDKEKISGLYSGLPGWARPYVMSISSIIEDSFGRYIRATLMLGLVVGTLTLIGLLIVGAPLAPLLAVLAGITEMIPIIGPWIGGTVAVVVTLALAPSKVLWVVVVALLVQLLENTLLVPRIQAAYFRIHPAITILLITVGGYMGGVWGVIFAVPLTATIVGVYRYCCQIPLPDELKLEEKQSDGREETKSDSV